MNDIAKPAVVLIAICAVITAALAGTYALTKDIIATSEVAAANALRQEVLPGASFGEPAVSLTDAEIKAAAYPVVTELYKDENGGGYVATVIAKGFGGDVTVIAGFGSDGNISGVRVASHSETPGLGANSTKPDFYEQYAGKPADAPLTVVKNPTDAANEITAISGATITSRAVTNAVNAAAEAVKAQG